MISLKNIKSHRGLFDLSVDSLELSQGDFTAILGNNGSGKSTFFSILTGLLQHEGEYQLLDKRFEGISLKERHQLIGYLPQKTELNMPFDVHYVILTGRFPFTNGFHYSKADHKATDEVIEQFELRHLRSRSFNELSGGEKQRVLLARILNRESPLILLDEPLNGIDLKHQHEVISLLKNLKQDKTILVVIHDLALAVREFDRFLVFSEGNLEEQYNRENLDMKRMAEIFGVSINTITHDDVLYVSTHLER